MVKADWWVEVEICCRLPEKTTALIRLYRPAKELMEEGVATEEIQERLCFVCKEETISADTPA